MFLTSQAAMELDLGLRQGFRIDDFEVHPLQQTIVSPRGTRKVSQLAIAFLIQLAAAPGQVVSGAALREHLMLMHPPTCINAGWTCNRLLAMTLTHHGISPASGLMIMSC